MEGKKKSLPAFKKFCSEIPDDAYRVPDKEGFFVCIEKVFNRTYNDIEKEFIKAFNKKFEKAERNLRKNLIKDMEEK